MSPVDYWEIHRQNTDVEQVRHVVKILSPPKLLETTTAGEL